VNDINKFSINFSDFLFQFDSNLLPPLVGLQNPNANGKQTSHSCVSVFNDENRSSRAADKFPDTFHMQILLRI